MVDFVDVVDAAPNTVITSAPATMSGLTAGAKTIAIVGSVGQLSVNGGAWGVTGSVVTGDQVRLRVTTPAGADGQITTVVVNVQSLGNLDWAVTNVNNTFTDVASVRGDVASVNIVSGFTPTEVAIALSSAPPTSSYPVVTEVATVQADLVSTSVSAAPLIDIATVSDWGGAVFRVIVTETATVSDGVVLPSSDILTDTAVVSDAAAVTTRAKGVLTDSALAVDAAFVSKSVVVTDTAVVSDGATITSRLQSIVTDTATVSDAALLGGAASVVVTDTATVSDWQRTIAQTKAYLHGGTVIVSDGAIYQDDSRGAWAVTLDQLALTRWHGLPFSQVHDIGGVLYGVSDDGVYRLDSADGVEAELTTGVYDFGKIEVKSLTAGYITAISDGAMELDAVRAYAAGSAMTTYRPSVFNTIVPNQYRVLFGRGRASRYWAFRLRNTDGLRLQLRDLRVMPLIGDRRI